MTEQDPILTRNAPLGPYTIVRKLGQGGMGGVYLGMHKVLQVNHAIKVIHPRMVTDAKVLERFMREARHAAKLNHPNIVPVVGADTVDGIPYIAMQYVDGRTLAQVTAAKGPLSPHAAVRYVHMVANALAYAHGRKVIHRDIKPANIMVDEEDVAKLMDFGLVRDMSQGPEAGATSDQLTMAGLIVGTPQYMPPEQWHGEGLDHRCDIFSLGVTLYFLISGNFPYPGKNTQEIFRSIMGGNPVPIRQRVPGLNPALAAVIDKACLCDAEARYATAGEFATALEEWWTQNAPSTGNTRLIRAPGRDATAAVSSSGSISGRGTSRGGSTLDIATLSTRAGTEKTPPAAPSVVQSSPAAQSSPTLLQAPASNKTILAAAAVIVLALVGMAVGLYVVIGGKDPAAPNGAPPANTPVVATLEFRVDVPPAVALESDPLRVGSAAYSIPGASSGKVTLNGKPYEFGAAITLERGLNRLELAATGEGDTRQSRTLFVVCDVDAPVLEVPALERARDGRLPVDGGSFSLRGTITDDDPGASIELEVDGKPRDLARDGNSFEAVIPLGDAPVQVDLRAGDRAGNKARPLGLWLVPDRLAPVLNWADGTTLRWFTAREVSLEGSANKTQGMMLSIGGKPLAMAEDGTFRVTARLEPGRHTIVVQAEDWLGRTSSLSREIKVDLEPPAFETLEPADGTVLQLEAVPARITVKGRLDSPEAVLTCNGVPVALAADAAFAAEVEATVFGELSVKLVARDPAGRETERVVKLTVSRLRYRLVGPNARGFNEYLRLTDNMIMVAVPAGEFEQGTAQGFADARKRNVKVSAFLIGKYEVTREQYCRFLNERKVSRDDVLARKWITPMPGGGMHHLNFSGGIWTPDGGTERQAATGVTWLGAREYTQWADPEGDLPTEAQWEYAARGKDGRPYPWGTTNPNPGRGHYLDGGLEDGSQVVDICADGVSPFGLFNMAGNVEEWCLDWYDVGAYGRPSGDDPKVTDKPSGGNRRVVRGGSFLTPVNTAAKPAGDDEPCDLRSFFRGRRLPDTGAADRGFRVASAARP